jgi:hypothetical protein
MRLETARIAIVVLAAGSAAAHGQNLVITDQVPGSFVDISGTGTPLVLDDDGVTEVVPGFNLAATLFAGDGTGRVWVSNNGAMGFLGDGGIAGAFWLNTALPNFGLFGGAHGEPQALAVYWDDIDADTGDVYHATIGEPGCRVFIVQWEDRPHHPGDPDLDGDEATFQVQIFESGGPVHAVFAYADVVFEDAGLDEGASATIGYQDGEDGVRNTVQWSFNEPGAVQAGTVLTLMDEVMTCPGDVDASGDVGFGDLLQVLAQWGPCCGCPQDFDRDGEVSFADLLVLLAAWGPCT